MYSPKQMASRSLPASSASVTPAVAFWMDPLLGAAVAAVLRYTLTVAALATVLPGCHKAEGEPVTAAHAATEDPPLKVSLVDVARVPMPRVLVLSGTLIPTQTSDVAAGASGKVVATYVERGTVVKQGAVLARLDARAANTAEQEATAALESSRAQHELAKADCARTQKMFDKGAISKADFDRAQTTCRAAEWATNAAQARKDSTNNALADTTIKAPFSGEIVSRTISAGEYVRPETKVATLIAVDPLRLELTVPEDYARQVQKDMKVDFRLTADPQAAPVHAVVRYVGPEVRRQTRDLLVEAVVQNPEKTLRPGMFVSARVDLGDSPAAVVPATAVREEGTLRHVFVVKDGRVEDRLVQLGEIKDDKVAVVSGLQADEHVVAPLVPGLRDGARVE